ncbi:lysophospholipid acyltransferase family protein [Lysobacter claricitrinus]|uniref:lysophospholipid acyltransferase family protein n=1 Tax=Lysobacter claricitrinus TaxID=3367728 RepID=UPI0037DAE981
MRRLARLVALLACALVLGIAQAVVLCVVRGDHRVATVLPMRFHRAVVHLLGLHVCVDGVASDAPRTAWVANHLSYLDVPVLGARLPARFVAKDEVRGWPLFGVLSRLQRTVFIGRRRTDAAAALDAMSRALVDGPGLVLFAEGTTSDGRDVRAFRSPVFATLAAVGDVMVQPVTLAVAGPDAAARRAYAYIEDDMIASHLWRFLGRARTELRLTLHPPVRADALGSDRKAAAAHVRSIVAAALTAHDP